MGPGAEKGTMLGPIPDYQPMLLAEKHGWGRIMVAVAGRQEQAKARITAGPSTSQITMEL